MCEKLVKGCIGVRAKYHDRESSSQGHKKADRPSFANSHEARYQACRCRLTLVNVLC